MDPTYARSYRILYEGHWWWRAREQLILETLRGISTSGRESILDVGCGDGLLFDKLSEFGDVQGVERNAAVIAPDSPYRDRIHIGAFDESFRPGRKFSLVLMLDVLEHLPQPAAALSDALRLLEPDGRLVATVPAFPIVWTGHDDLNRHLARYTKQTFELLARRAGMRIESSRYYFHWMFPVKLALRFTESVARRAPSLPRIPPAPVNAALYAVSQLEHRILGSLAVPFGTSLFVVGRREDTRGLRRRPAGR